MTTPAMPYRRLGPTGLKISVLSFGSWVSFGTQLDTGMARDCLAAAREAGVNFFDNAEAYAGGESERIMGRAISELNWSRETYVVSSKFFWGLTEGVNTRNTLNRKYLMHAIDGSLERFGLDFLDVIFCHRPDPETPVEETVAAMSDIIESGRAHYWGVSEWSADESRAALPGYEWLKDGLTNERRNQQVRELMGMAERLDVSVAQLAIAWCAANPHVSTVITGASRPEQVVENMGALRALEQLTPEVKSEIEDICRRR